MRRKIAKRRRKDAISLGAEIVKEGWIREPSWKRKDIGYCVDAEYCGWMIMACGHDELEAYKALLECMKDPYMQQYYFEIRGGVVK